MCVFYVDIFCLVCVCMCINDHEEIGDNEEISFEEEIISGNHFECKKCGKVFETKRNLKRHLNNKMPCTKKINRPYKVCKEKILLFKNYLV